MISLVLRVIAFVLFFAAGCGQTWVDQPPADLVAFGLAAWVLATIVGGYGPAAPWGRRSE